MEKSKTRWYENLNAEKWNGEYPSGSLFAYIKETSLQYRNHAALVFEGKKYTYQQLLDGAQATAAALLANGVKKGDTVSIVSPNTPQAVFMFYAVNRIGAIANMIHPLLSANEIQQMIEQTESKVVLTLDMIYPKFAKYVWNLPVAPKMVLARIADALPLFKRPVYNAKNKLDLKINPTHDVVYWNDFLASGKNTPLPSDDGAADDTAVILYSGGTSGNPKGVLLSNFNCNAQAAHMYDVGGIEDTLGKRSLVVMPLFHGFGLIVCLHGMLSLGMQLYLVPKYDFNACSKLIIKKKLNCVYGVPGLFEALLRSQYIEGADLSFMDLLVSGGDKLPEKLQLRMDKALQNGGSRARLREAYGQTECVAGCAMSPHFDIRIGSAGIAYPDVLLKIVKNGTQEEVPDGEDGELCISGPIVMKGYYKNEAETAKALQRHADGRIWLHTGDSFAKDAEGYLYFRQRNSRLIICGGYNVYATQIEEVIRSCPAVAQCCVVGKKDRIYGEKIVAFIVLNSKQADQKTVSDSIMTCCKENLSAYSLPHELIFKEELPVTKMGKTDYVSLQHEVNKGKE